MTDCDKAFKKWWDKNWQCFVDPLSDSDSGDIKQGARAAWEYLWPKFRQEIEVNLTTTNYGLKVAKQLEEAIDIIKGLLGDTDSVINTTKRAKDMVDNF